MCSTCIGGWNVGGTEPDIETPDESTDGTDGTDDSGSALDFSDDTTLLLAVAVLGTLVVTLIIVLLVFLAFGNESMALQAILSHFDEEIG